MSISKTSTRQPYGDNTSDLQIGDYVRFDLARDRKDKSNIVVYAKCCNYPLMIITGFEDTAIGNVVLVDDVATGEPIRSRGGSGLFHCRFVRDEFLTAAKKAIKDAKV